MVSLLGCTNFRALASPKLVVETFVKYLFVLVILNMDGSYEFRNGVYDSCPPQELVISAMEEQKIDGDFQDWGGYCLPVHLSGSKGVIL